MSSLLKFAQRVSEKYDDKRLLSLLNEVKRELINAYNLYVNTGKPLENPYSVVGRPVNNKEGVFQFLAEYGERVSRDVIEVMGDLIFNIENYSLLKIFNRINKVLSLLNKKDEVRNYLYDNVKVEKTNMRQPLQAVLVNVEKVFSRLASILNGLVKKLKPFIPNVEEIIGDDSRFREELSVGDVVKFIREWGNKYNILSNEEWRILVEHNPGLLNRLTTVINAVKRGHTPKDINSVKIEIDELLRNHYESKGALK